MQQIKKRLEEKQSEEKKGKMSDERLSVYSHHMSNNVR